MEQQRTKRQEGKTKFSIERRNQSYPKETMAQKDARELQNVPFQFSSPAVEVARNQITWRSLPRHQDFGSEIIKKGRTRRNPALVPIFPPILMTNLSSNR